MIIGIDIDNTIINTHTYTKKYLKMYDPSITSGDYHELSNERRKDFLNKYFEKITGDVDTLPDAIKSINYLKEKRCTINIITARCSEGIDVDVKGFTLKALKKLGVYYDNIYFNYDHKGEIANKLKLDLFIDDKESNLDEVSSHNIECFRFLEEKNYSSKYRSFTSWKDIINYLDRGNYFGK